MINSLSTISSSVFWRSIVTVAGGLLSSIICQTAPYMIICTLIIFADCLSAWALARRVKKKFPDIASPDTQKFKSSHFGKVLLTLLKVYALIVFSYLIQYYIFENLPLRLPNITAGAIITWQLWSILENESSCNNAKWAKFAQKIFIDKSARHLDMSPEELRELLSSKDEDNNNN